MSQIHGMGQAQQNSPIEQLNALFANLGIKGSDGQPLTIPDVVSNDSIGIGDLPDLPAPSSSSLSLDTLLSAIGDEVRRQACKDGVASLEAKGERQAEINQKELEEIAERLEKMREKSVASKFLKAFQVIGAIVGLVASAASVVAGAITGNPLLIAAGAIGAVASFDGMLSAASDGKYSIAAGFTALGKACGMNDEDAQWFGFGMNMGIMVISIGVTLGAGFASSSSAIANITSQSLQTAAKVINTTAQVGNIASGITSIGTGSATIANAVIDYQIGMSQADSKELQAILERIRQSIEMDRALVEAEMERANALLADVKEIVQNCNDTQTAMLTMNPSLA